MNIDLDDAKALIALAEVGSISQAACELRLTQPAVTRRVQRLEQALGAQLVDRRRRPFGLTDIGQVALERCRRLMASAEELKALRHGLQTPSREARVGVAHALTEFALFEPIETLRRTFPNLSLRLHTGWSRDLVARLKTGALDAAVVLLPEFETPDAAFETRALASEHLTIIAPRARKSQRWTWREFADHSWILNPEGCAARAWLMREAARAGYALKVGVESYNYELQMSLVVRAQGLGFVPSRLLAQSRSRAKLCTLHLRGVDFPMTIWLLSLTGATSLAEPLSAFGEALIAKLR